MRMGRTGWVLSGIGLVIVVIFAVRIIQLMADEEPSPTVDEIRESSGMPVVVVDVERGNLETWRRFSGTVTGEREAVIRARSDDEIREIRVRVGDRVQAGQMIVRQAGQGSDARVRQAEASVRQAERNVERLRPLWEAGALSDQDWEDANTQLELAQADLEAVAEVQGGVAPIAGIVSEVPARVGSIPAAGDPLVRVVDDSSYRIPLQMSERQAGEIDRGMRAEVSGVGTAGEVDRVAIQASALTRLVEVEVRFPGTASLRPGTFVNVGILVAETEDTILVPDRAIRDGGVWVLLDDDTVEFREVEIGLRNDEMVEILSGLDEGEVVVVEGASLLSDGALVQVVD
ncbi:MAG: efflux RND transporter periplasmic adaptor subunit [Gemmatimonadales bacterium]|nr:MAG: efflux RND transporter periplasmic adaptor subunit [Gemmatimonadales bacterium]